ncbi:MAG: hypothetical protein I3273_07735, partial [Candidatus Moeniiplasma glomeromycotorum]|nr:hypothetical protein [Candidatus Moeniiplasma glomeromycotorum]
MAEKEQKVAELAGNLEKTQEVNNRLAEVIDKLSEPGTARKIFNWSWEQQNKHPYRSSAAGTVLFLLGKDFYEKFRNTPKVKELETQKTD